MDDEGPWRHSTEGDLDPDLTEEAGYAYWEPPKRAWLPLLLGIVAVLIALSLIAGAIVAVV